jgi:hypothetical protein
MSEPNERRASTAAAASPEPPPRAESAPQVSDLAELLRIGNMVGSLLEEAHASTMDDAGRRRLADVYQRAVDAVKGAVSADLRGELSDLGFSVDNAAASESELRLAQAQLVGWLNGLLLGLQAAAANQARLQVASPSDAKNIGELARRRTSGGYA